MTPRAAAYLALLQLDPLDPIVLGIACRNTLAQLCDAVAQERGQEAWETQAQFEAVAGVMRAINLREESERA